MGLSHTRSYTHSVAAAAQQLKYILIWDSPYAYGTAPYEYSLAAGHSSYAYGTVPYEYTLAAEQQQQQLY